MMRTMERNPDDWDDRSHELRDLLARSGMGDRLAFATLYERTSPHLFAVVLRIQRDRPTAEELLQDIYVSVWKAAASFDAARSQPLTWLTSIARNRAIDSVRRAQARPVEVSPRDRDTDDGDDGPDLVQAEPDGAPSAAELLDRASDARRITLCMQALSAQQRQSIALAFFDGLSHAEIAQHLREPLGTVKSWVRRALTTLKSCLEHAVRGDSGGTDPLDDGDARGSALGGGA
jgi:RNA polymerase sigma factor (sigma-70 family)